MARVHVSPLPRQSIRLETEYFSGVEILVAVLKVWDPAAGCLQRDSALPGKSAELIEIIIFNFSFCETVTEPPSSPNQPQLSPSMKMSSSQRFRLDSRGFLITKTRDPPTAAAFLSMWFSLQLQLVRQFALFAIAKFGCKGGRERLVASPTLLYGCQINYEQIIPCMCVADRVG